MDIKELVTEIALVADGLHVDPKCRDVEFATRLIAAYLAEQEPVVRVVDGGGELHLPKLQWVSANVSLETPIGSDLFLAPPLPAIPDGCVVVPKDLIDAAKNLLAVKGRHHTELAYKQLCQALIAAGGVK